MDVRAFQILSTYSVADLSSAGPGSFIEVRKVLPLLTSSSPDHPSFHVVALSLPGYGFSEDSKKQGFRLAQYAEVCPSTGVVAVTLMQRNSIGC